MIRKSSKSPNHSLYPSAKFMLALFVSWNGLAPGSSCWNLLHCVFTAREISNKKERAWPECSRKCWCPQPGANVLSRLKLCRKRTNYVWPEKCISWGNWNLAKLSPVLIGGILRVGGRLSRAPLPDESRHQIIISKDSPLGVLLIRFFHEKSGHSGREDVLALLRKRFWLIRANTI